MDMNQFQRWTPWLLRNYCSSRAVIVIEIAATGDAAVRRMELLASRSVEFVKALHGNTMGFSLYFHKSSIPLVKMI